MRQVLRSVLRQLDPEEAKALKKLRKRWLKSANQLNVDGTRSQGGVHRVSCQVTLFF
jgi:hypothetical protein